MIVLLIFNFLSLLSSKETALQEISVAFGWNWNLTDPCGVNRLFWVCSKDQLHLTTLVLPGSKTNEGVLPSSLANFKSLTYLGVNRYYGLWGPNYNMYIPESYWSTIGDKVNLSQITCENNCIQSFPSNLGAGFPTALENVFFAYLNVQVPSSIFSSTVKYFHIFNASTGLFPLPELQTTSSPIVKLGFGVDATIPSSWTGFKNMTALWFGNTFTSTNPALDVTTTKINNIEIEKAPTLFKTFTSSAAPYAYVRSQQQALVNWFSWKGSSSSGYTPSIGRFNIYDGSSKIDLSNNNLTGNIPLPVNGVFVKSFSLTLDNNLLTGVVPEDFCGLESDAISVAYNKLGDKGSAPSSLQVNCTSFAITGVSSNLIPTTGGSVTVTGTSLGWTVGAAKNNVPTPQFITFNTKLYFNVPKGMGVNITYPYLFHNQRQSYNYTFSYMPPNITGATVQSNNLYIQGSNFGESTGIIVTSIANKTISYISVSDTQIRYSTNPLGTTVLTDTIFCVRLNVSGNYVEKVLDYLTGTPLLVKPYPSVNSSGGVVTFNASHVGHDPTLVSLSINNIPCPLTKQNNGISITCQVPPGSGSVPISLKVYNYTFTDTFTYSQNNGGSTTTATSSQSTSSTTTTATTTTSTTGNNPTTTSSTTTTMTTTSDPTSSTTTTTTTDDFPSNASTTTCYSFGFGLIILVLFNLF
ncbi:DdFRP1alpha [Cavenderia fasciculata]|uniref:DdFRP1alpha n=1 Tax=Cavenderia fasciculata TaxID=261658 RepID=F4Q6U7_CACFS|nr:DdFRP1alpha [Cavenderia fasciculata]EGG16129.1 DdFRP1alpha [Cavenderia fasciculata]|eukprot:XP_004352582.1 DdFRP1alpha [Cavenderia fasciculata]